MNWFANSLLSAVSRATNQTLRKYSIKFTSPLVMTIGLRAFALPFLVLFGLLFSEFMFPNNSSFWLIILAAGAIETIATVSSFKSLKKSDLSHVAPLQALIPVFILPVSLIVFRDFPPLVGVLGVFLIVLGVYILNIKKGSSIAEPFIFLKKDPGSFFMVLYAALSAIVFVLEKKALTYSNPTTVLTVMYLIQIIALIPFPKSHKLLDLLKPRLFRPLSLIAVLTAISHLLQFYAIQAIYASYAIAVQRVDIILMVIFGWVFLGEKKRSSQLLASLVVTSGLVLLALNQTS